MQNLVPLWAWLFGGLDELAPAGAPERVWLLLLILIVFFQV